MQKSVDSKSRFYKPELDVLRFIAFLLVLMLHVRDERSGLGAIGSAGLPVFFTLSSYLITELLLRERELTGTIHLSDFFKRRALRIWPLYFVFVGTTFVCSQMFHGSFTPKALAYFTLLSANWYVFQFGWFVSPVIPLWSISVEEQFYLLWPTIARWGGKRGLWAAVAVSYVSAFAAIIYLCRIPRADWQIETNSFVQFQFFGLGAALALILHNRRYVINIWSRLALFGLSLVSVILAIERFHLKLDDEPAKRVLAAYILMGICSAALFLSILGTKIPAIGKPFVFLGRISYGLYVFHFVIYFYLRSRVGSLPFHNLFLPTLTLTIGCAVVSYYCLERPFLLLKKRFVYVANRID